jgi:hypothetical protein
MKPLSVIALGYIGDKNTLPENLAEREAYNRVRKSMDEIFLSSGF